jgi:hypothetical protein
MHSCILDIFAVNQSLFDEGPGWLNELRSLDLTTHTQLTWKYILTAVSRLLLLDNLTVNT